MQKLLFFKAGLLSISLVFSASSFAQEIAYQAKTLDLKASLPYLAMEDDKALSSKINIDANKKLQQSFNSYFKDANNVEWYAIDKSYLAKFDNQGRKARAMFGKNGHIYYAVTEGTEKSLPKDLRRMLKSSYVDFEIINVSEIYSENTVAWLTTLKDENHIVIARIIDNSMDEYARYSTSLKTKPERKGHIVIPKN